MSLIIVSTTEELKTALENASGGDRIEMAAGDYGAFFLRDQDYDAQVTITAQDPDNPPVFDNIRLWNVGHLTFDGITVNRIPNEDTMEWSTALSGNIVNNIQVINSTITGGNAIAGVDPDTEPGQQGKKGINGFPVGVGVGFGNGEDILIENTSISGFTKGIGIHKSDGVTILDNNVFNIRKVPYGTIDVDNQLIEGNHFHDMKPWKFGGLGDHGDFIHIVTSTSQTQPNENIVIRDNYFAQADGAAVLGIYLDDNNNNQGFRNVLIEDNVIHNSNYQGIRLEDVVGGVVRNNTLLPAGEGVNTGPRIMLQPGTRDVVVENNITSAIIGSALEDKAGNQITIGNNLIVQRDEPMSDGYVGSLFANPMATHPLLTELAALPGSAAEGFGARIDLDEGKIDYIEDIRGSGQELNQHVFDLRTVDTDGQHGALEGAEVVWDFGDGQNGSGLSDVHAYARAGLYNATATVTLESGARYVIHKTVQVLSPVALVADFDNGLRDESDMPLDAQMIGSVSLVDSDHGQAIRLGADRSAVKFNASEEILENPEFTISMGFQKDAAGDAGRVLYFSGTAVIDVRPDGVLLRGANSDGQVFTLMADGIGVNDTDWHQITYTYSQETGTATLYVDGVAVDSETGLTGIQHTTGGHGLHLGNPMGASMDGLLDDVTFLRHALDADQAAEHYTAFEQGERSEYAMVSEVETISPSAPAPVTPVEPDPVEPVVAPEVEPERDEGPIRENIKDLTEEQSGPDQPQPELASGFIFDQQSDRLSLGRMEHLEGSDQLSFTVDYFNADEAHEATRLVWNHRKVGVILKDDGVILQVATEDEGFKQFRINDLGLDDSDVHRLTVNLDAEDDILQLLVDGEKVFEETDTDFEIVTPGAREHGWHLGTLWGGEFQGSILNFEAIDKFSFDEDAPATTYPGDGNNIT